MKRWTLIRWSAVACVGVGVGIGGAGGCSPQAKPARHLARAARYVQAEQYQEASIEYLNVLKAEPTNQVANRGMGVALYEMGEARTAIHYLMKAEAQDPADVEIRMKLGMLFMAVGDRRQARDRAEWVLRERPDHWEALVLWGAGASTSGEVEEALTRLSAVLPQFANEPKFLVALASLHLKKGDFEGAEDIYKKGLETMPQSWEIHLALGDLSLLRRDSIRADQEYQLAADLAPVKSLARVKLARFHWAGGKADDAKVILDELLKQVPTFTAAIMARAEIALSERDYEVALTLLKGIMKSSPSNLDAFLLMQKVKLAQGKTDDVVAAYEKLVSAFPKAAQSRYLLGMVWMVKGDIQKAREEGERALALDADHWDSIRLLAEIYIRTGQPDRSLAVLKPYLKRHPNEGLAYVLAGAAYGAQKDFARAADTYRELIKHRPDNLQGPYLLGLALRRLGRNDEAIALFEDVLKHEPGSSEALEQLAGALLVLDPTGEAVVKRIEKQIEQVPDVAGHHFLLGTALSRTRDWDLAEKAFLRAVELRPEITAAYVGLSHIYLQTHKEDQALGKLDKALTVNSNDVTVLMLKATILMGRKNPVLAAAQYERILAIRPSFVPALNNLACLYQATSPMNDKAFELAKQARSLAPRDPHVADTFGWILCRRGDYKWALTLLQEAAELLDAEPEVLYHLGVCQAALGNEQAARASVVKSMELSSSFAGFDEAKKMLTVLSAGKDLAEYSTPDQVEAFLALCPDHPLALVKAGAFYLRSGDRERARSLYEKAIALNASFVPGLLGLADVWAGSFKQLDRALDFAKQARASAPGDPQVADRVASIAYLKGDYKWVQSLMTESIRQAGATPERQYLLGLSHYALGKTDAATNLLTQALQASPGFESAADARRFLERVRNPVLAMEGNPAADGRGTLPVENLPLVMHMAGVHEQKGDKDRARLMYAQVVAQYPEFSPAYRRLALIFMGQKTISDPDFKLLVRARELLPDDPDVGRSLGEAAYLKGQYEWASRLLLESSVNFPDRADIYYYLGMSYHQIKNMTAARKALSKALELDSQSGLAPRARELLETMK
jgi:tetratricopeptide (TPR) repeat protein